MSESKRRAASFRNECAIVSVLDAVAITLALFGLLSFSLLLAAHGLLILTLVHAAWRYPINATTQSEMIIATTFFAVFGPAGGLAVILIDLIVRHHKAPQDELYRWYKKLAAEADNEPSSMVFDEISNGRSVAVSPEFPPSFQSVMEMGQLSNQRWILGKAASDYHSDYRSLLFDALRSPIPAIRVQAAAIVNGLRTAFRKTINADLDELEHNTDIAEAIDPSISVLDQLGSGLLEDADLDRSIAAIRKVFQSSVAGVPTPGNLSRLKNHIVWAAGRVPDQSQRDRLLALAVTISASINARACTGNCAYG